MAETLLSFIFMLGVIFVAAELFTNALEHLGERLKISEGVTGSLFAAVGTALPETLIPIIAIISGETIWSGHSAIAESTVPIRDFLVNPITTASTSSVHHEIGVGAILGAPLMLSTLAPFLMCLSVLGKRGLKGQLTPENSGFKRDLNFFILAFCFSFIAMFIPHQKVYIRLAIGMILVLIYFIYILLTVRASARLVKMGHGTEAGRSLFLALIISFLPRNPTREKRERLMGPLWLILLQLMIGLALLVYGAHGFVDSVRHISEIFTISALLISLLMVPIATELPEKINSILWIRMRKDTLAFGNITGAMVFQGTLLPALGVMLTPWEPRIEVFTVVAMTLIAAFWLRYQARKEGKPGFPNGVLLVNGLLYFAYLALMILPNRS